MSKLAVILMVVSIVFLPEAPSVTNPLCYSNPAYRDTHEQECVIDQVTPTGGNGNNGDGGGLIRGLLHHLGGLL